MTMVWDRVWDRQELRRRERLDDDPAQDEPEEEPEDEGAGGDEEDRLQEKVLKTRTIMLSESISEELARKVYQQLIILEAESKEKPITLIINSPGGEADSGFGLYDMIRFVAPPVRTLVAGLCASAAIIVFLAGKQGQRMSLPNSRFMMHQPSSQTFGQATDLEIASNEILRLRERYNRIVAEVTGKDLAVVGHDVDRDFWLGAEEARAYGLVERIVVSRAEFDPA
jgi:ATP-dependent Clp protease, protease subunit